MRIFNDLQNKRIVITGGASGIGLASAKRFLEEESKVFLLDWNQKALDAALKENPGFSGGFAGDVSDPDHVHRAFQEMDTVLGGIDVLISNAGISVRKPFLKIDYAQWSKVLRVNLDGMFLCAQQAIQRMQKQKTGVILLTGSTNVLEEVNAEIPLNRHAKPEEVAGLFAFLASEQAGYITGQTIPIDGGETAGQFIRNIEQ
jgi:meso-butanediol dehydrogenase/(S,S)-butanediol dehydrogenase/diacetyl reductase